MRNGGSLNGPAGFPQKAEDKPVGNRLGAEVAKLPALVAKSKCGFLLNSTEFTRTFPSAATGKPDAARVGRRVRKRNAHPRIRIGVSAPSPGSEVLRDRGSGPTAVRWEGTSAPFRRDGGPIGTSAGNGRGPRREVWGPRLRPRDPAADFLREIGSNPERPQSPTGATIVSAMVESGRPRGRSAAGRPQGRKVA